MFCICLGYSPRWGWGCEQGPRACHACWLSASQNSCLKLESQGETCMTLEKQNLNRSSCHVIMLSFLMLFTSQGSGSGHSPETFRLLHAKNVQRPQLKFKDKVDNSNTPFVPKIFVKPNATVPLPTCKDVEAPHDYSLSVLGLQSTALLNWSSLSDFTNKHLHKQRPEDLDVPAALADFIHQQRTQEQMEDM